MTNHPARYNKTLNYYQHTLYVDNDCPVCVRPGRLFHHVEIQIDASSSGPTCTACHANVAAYNKRMYDKEAALWKANFNNTLGTIQTTDPTPTLPDLDYGVRYVEADDGNAVKSILIAVALSSFCWLTAFLIVWQFV